MQVIELEFKTNTFNEKIEEGRQNSNLLSLQEGIVSLQNYFPESGGLIINGIEYSLNNLDIDGNLSFVNQNTFDLVKNETPTSIVFISNTFLLSLIV